MADLSSLLNSGAEDLKEVLIPVGTWEATVKGGKLTDEKEDKNGRPFVQALFFLELTAPKEDVDPQEVAEMGLESIQEETVFFRFGPIYGRSEMRRLKNMLVDFGVQESGRTIPEMMKELKKIQPSIVAEIEHDEYEGETRTKVTKAYSTEA